MRRFTGRALLAAAALAAEAQSNLSPAGAAFLALYLVWGLVATRPSAALPSRPAATPSLVLWSCAAAVAFVVLLLQLLLPLLPYNTVGPGSLVWSVLGLHDLSQCGGWELLAALSPPLLCALAALAEAQDAYTACCHGDGGAVSRGGAGSGSAASAAREGALQPATGATALSRPMGPSLRQAAEPSTACPSSELAGTGDGRNKSGAGRHTAGADASGAAPTAAASAAATGLLVALAALLWPAVFNLPWLLLASWSLALWALRLGLSPAAHAPLLRLLQLYGGVALAALYGWQLQAPDAWPRAVAQGGRALGLYRLRDPTTEERHVYDVVLQAFHTVALTALYGALGFAAKAAAERARRSRQTPLTRGSVSSPAAAAAAPAGAMAAAAAAPPEPGHLPHPDPLREPLLPSPQPSRVPPVLVATAASPSPHRPHAGEVGPGGSTAGAAAEGPTSDLSHGHKHREPQSSHHSQPPPPPQQQQQRSNLHPPHPHRHHRHSGVHSVGAEVVARSAAAVVTAVEALCGHPGVAAVALAGMSMVEVSVLGGALLAGGMWALLAPGRYGQRLLRRVSPVLTLLLLTWNTAVYVVTCLSASYPHLLPPVLHSLGLFMYDSPPPVVLSLTGQALAIVAVAGLARSISTADSIDGGSGGNGAAAGRASVAGTSLGLTLVLALYHSLHVLVPCSWILLGSYQLDLLHGAYLLWVLMYCGSTAVQLNPDPRVAAVLPDIRRSNDNDAAAGGAATVVGDSPAAAPSQRVTEVMALPPVPLPAAPPSHRLLRLFASLHLLALYGAMCGHLPGLGFLQREEWRGVLRLVGLWAPSRTADCLPLLAALVLATAHAVTGRVLVAAAAGTAGAAGGRRPPAAVQGWLLALGASLGSVASSVGHLLLAVLLYVLILYDMRVGLLGLGYVALGLPLLLAPPRRGRYVALLRLSHHRSGLHSQPLKPQRLLLAAPGVQRHLAASVRWLAAAGLALYCAFDLCVSYAAATIAVYGPSPPPPDQEGAGWRLAAVAAAVTEWWWRLMGVLYGGTPPTEPGVALGLALARPSCLLLAMQLYRWAFAAAAVRKWMRRHERGALPGSDAEGAGGELPHAPGGAGALASPAALADPTTAPPAWAGSTPAGLTSSAPQLRPRQLSKQSSTAWFVKRWLILHVDLLAVVLLFASLMASPGALSLGLLTAAVAAAQAAVCCNATAASARAPDVRHMRPRRQGAAARRAHYGDAAAAASFFALAKVTLVAALLILYALQLAPVAGWVRAVSGAGGGGGGDEESYASWSPAAVLEWLGLPLCGSPGGGASPTPPPPPFPPLPSSPWQSPPLPLRPLPVDGNPSLDPVAAGFAAGAYAPRRLLGEARGALSTAAAAAPGSGGGGGNGGVGECAPAPGLRLRLGLGLLALAALALRGKAFRWRSKLPAEVVAAAAPGQPCCLFWPPPSSRPDTAVAAWLGPRAPLQRAVRRALAPMASVTNQVLSRLGRGAYDVLKAMDVPADQLVLPPGDAAAAAAGNQGANDGSSDVDEADRHEERVSSPPLPPPRDNTGVSSSGSEEQRPAAPQPGVYGGNGGGGATAPPDPAAGHGGSGSGPATAPRPTPFHAVGDAGAGAVGHAGATAPAPAPTLAGNGGGSSGRHHRRGGGDGGDDLGSRVLFCVQLLARSGMEAWEGAWAEWGGEVALLALLLAAFTCCSVVSLPLLAALGAGMAASPRLQALLRRHAVLPLLGLLLLYQYGAWVGLPRLLLPALGRPPPYPVPSRAVHLAPALAAWLGLQAVGPLVPWALFGALGVCVMQVNTELGEQQLPQQQGLQQPGAASDADSAVARAAGSMEAGASSRGARGGGRGLWVLPWRRASWAQEATVASEGSGGNDLEAPLLPPPPPLPAAPEVVAEARAAAWPLAPSGPDLRRVRRSAKSGGGSSDGDADGGSGGGVCRPSLFAPVAAWAQPQWGLLDWCRYYLVRHAADVLLVALVGLVALQRDLLRAGYLAHCLLLFRRRGELSSPGGAGGALFGRLVGFNLVVLLLEGAFQAPWELLLGPSWALPCTYLAEPIPDGGGGGGGGGGGASTAPACTFPRLMGLCQLQPGRAMLSGQRPNPANASLLAGDGDDVAANLRDVPTHGSVAAEGRNLLAAAWSTAAGGPPLRGPPLPDRGMWSPWLALASSPVVADVVVWLLLRLYARLLRSRLFAAVAAVAAARQRRHVAALREEVRRAREAAARGALDSSQARAVRSRRIAMLKALLLSPGDAAATDGLSPAGDDDEGNGNGRTTAMAAYYRALHGALPGGGVDAAAASTAGGGPAVTGLADLLDNDVDLSDVAAAAAAGAGLESGARHTSGGGGSLSYRYYRWSRECAGAGAVGGASPGASIGLHRSVGRATSLVRGLDPGGSSSGSGGPRSRAPRRSRSFAYLEDIMGPHERPEAPIPTPPQPLPQHTRPASSAVAYAQCMQPQRSGGGGGAAHRRHASAEVLALFGAADLRGHRPAVTAGAGGAAAETEPVPAEPAAPPLTAQPQAWAGRRGRADGRGPAARRGLSWSPLLVWLYGKLVAPLVAAAQRRRLDDDSYTCYAAYLLLLLADMSVLAAVMPLSMLLYSLLLTRKPSQYWQAALLYAEGVLILQYSYLVLGRCLCAAPADAGGAGGGAGAGAGVDGPSCLWMFGRRGFLYRVQLLGLHAEPSRCLLLFIAYLATLMHTLRLHTVYAAVEPQPQPPSSALLRHQQPIPPPPPPQRPSLLSSRWLLLQLRRAAWAVRRLAIHLGEVFGTVTSQHKVGPHWVKLQLAIPQPPPRQPPPQPQCPGALPPPQEQVSVPSPEHLSGLPPRPILSPPPGEGRIGGSGSGGAAHPHHPPVLPTAEAAAQAVLPPGAETPCVVAAASAEPPPEVYGVELLSGSAAPGGTVVVSEGPPMLAEGQASASRPTYGYGSYGMLQGQQLLDGLQQLLAAVHDYGRRLEQRRWQEAAWRRQRQRRRWRSTSLEVAGMADGGGGGGDSDADEDATDADDDDDDGLAEGRAAAPSFTSAAAAVAIERFAHYRLPQLRLHHDPVVSRTAVHVLLEVVTSPGAVPAADGRPVSPTPAQDVAVVLRHCVELLRRQRQSSPVPPYAGRSPISGGGPGEAGRGDASGSSGGDGDDGDAGGTLEAPPCGATAGYPGPPPPLSPPPPGPSAPTVPSKNGAATTSGSKDPTAATSAATRPHVDGGDTGLRQRRPPSAASVSTAGGAVAASHRRHSSVGSLASLASAAGGAAEPPEPPPPPPPPLPPPKLHLPEPPGLPPILSVESYSKPPRDLYGPTAVLDLISFMYALVFYQLVVSSARSLADITDVDRRLPLDYLAALMLLFALMVSERAVYMLGWPSAKMGLHLASMVLVMGWCMRAFWASVATAEGGGAVDASAVAAAEAGVRRHLRAFVLLRLGSLALGALQLRDGFPPLSSPGPAGGGRHSSFFYRRADWAHSLAFNVFYAIPFLYEIRSLLDWTCISTSLDWYSWLKLEDIRSSLFVATCRNMERRGRRLGQRVPRYVKFLQGFLALVALLLVLWLPPLFFSSGAPTYQVPALMDVRVNISIAWLSGGPDAAASVQRFPLFATGDRRLIFRWTAPPPPEEGGDGDGEEERPGARPLATMPPGLSGSSGGGGGSGRGLPRALSGYAADQAIGVCLASDSDTSWRISPPARRALLDLLLGQGNGKGKERGREKDENASEPEEASQHRRLSAAAVVAGSGGPGGGWSAAAGGEGAGGDTDAAPLVLEIGWSFTRSAPLTSQYGGPSCTAATSVPLSESSRRGLAEVLSGAANRTLLTALNTTDPASHGSPGLFPLFLRLMGETCSVRLGLGLQQRSDQAAQQGPGVSSWPSIEGWLSQPQRPGRAPGDGAGLAAVRRRSDISAGDQRWRRMSWVPQWGPGRSSGGDGGGAATAATGRYGASADAAAADADVVADRWGAALVGCYASREGGPAGAAEWWAFECGALLPPTGSSGVGGVDGGVGLGGEEAPMPLAEPCGSTPGGPRGLSGPPLVAVIEPVQSGLLGATLSRFGITGLYVTFVFAIGRFLRLSVSSLRLRIPTEDLPSTRRLVELCQDIYVARAEGELVLEEQLFRALINVYRSPELLFELSRKKHKQA